LERLLRRERVIVGAGLAVLVLLAWAWLFAGAGMGALMGSMPGMGEMPMAEMPGMQLSWSASTWALLLAMWWVMMIAMMTPSAAPTILLYARVQRSAEPDAGGGVAPTMVFVAGYLLVWLVFSLAAVAVQFALDRGGLLDGELMRSQHRALSAGLLLFVFGVMNMAWVAALAVLVLAEKLLPHGEFVGRAVGVILLIGAACFWWASGSAPDYE
jgi:predicted metal-binding membrane protein